MLNNGGGFFSCVMGDFSEFWMNSHTRLYEKKTLRLLDFGLLDFWTWDFGLRTLDFWNFLGVVFLHDLMIQIFTHCGQRRHSLHTDNREAVLVSGRHRRDVYAKEHIKADAGSEYVGQWQTLSRKQRLVGIRLHVGASLSLFLSHSPRSPARALNRFVCRCGVLRGLCASVSASVCVRIPARELLSDPLKGEEGVGWVGNWGEARPPLRGWGVQVFRSHFQVKQY